MNIFIMILVFLFMAGWYFMDSPSQNIQEHGIEYAVDKSEKNSILTCVAHVQAEAVRLDDADRIDGRAIIDNDTACAAKYNIETVKICVEGDRRFSATCIPDRAGRSINNFLISFAPKIIDTDADKFLELLSAEYSDTKNLGILAELDRRFYILSGSAGKREVPSAIIKELKLQPGQLIYVTQYSITGKPVFSFGKQTESIRCASGEIKLFRFNKWSCVPQNAAIVCRGDTIWSTDLSECVADPMRRPLCDARQTAVMADDFWKCVDPLPQKNCPDGQSLHLDYATMEWFCTTNPAESKLSTKCDRALRTKAAGVMGATVLNPIVSCNDCEEMVTDPDTCESVCVPSVAKLSDRLCYSGECSGAHRAFYFGFPDSAYAESARKNISELDNLEIPTSGAYSQNRKFNCLDCGTGYIDTDTSKTPFTAVCK
ncbi:MAG: hypothetical protein LBK26_03705 [Rickettsiales bacterium]|jgi:hypothetical protein|nr:hypothetical protein [Rickettsiales bacterium]